MTDQSAGRKAAPTRKLKKEQSVPTPSTPQSEAQGGKQPKIGGPSVGSRLEKAISELRGLQELLFSGDLANVTAVRFDFEERPSSRITPACSPSWRSTTTASNFRQFNRRIDAGTS